MGRTGRTLVAGFDAVVMAVAAYVETGGRFALTPAELVLWGSAVSAALCAVVVFTSGSPFVAWSAIGYIVFGGLLTDGSPHWPLLALALALTPLVPRPRGSVLLGIAVALLVAVAARAVIGALL
jgi:hypothetical protein